MIITAGQGGKNRFPLSFLYFRWDFVPEKVYTAQNYLLSGEENNTNTLWNRLIQFNTKNNKGTSQHYLIYSWSFCNMFSLIHSSYLFQGNIQQQLVYSVIYNLSSIKKHFFATEVFLLIPPGNINISRSDEGQSLPNGLTVFIISVKKNHNRLSLLGWVSRKEHLDQCNHAICFFIKTTA